MRDRERERERERGRQTETERERKTDSQTVRHTDRQTGSATRLLQLLLRWSLLDLYQGWSTPEGLRPNSVRMYELRSPNSFMCTATHGGRVVTPQFVHVLRPPNSYMCTLHPHARVELRPLHLHPSSSGVAAPQLVQIEGNPEPETRQPTGVPPSKENATPPGLS